MSYKFNIMKMHSKLGQGKFDTNVFLKNIHMYHKYIYVNIIYLCLYLQT